MLDLLRRCILAPLERKSRRRAKLGPVSPKKEQGSSFDTSEKDSKCQAQ